jgi:hypothetical protein
MKLPVSLLDSSLLSSITISDYVLFSCKVFPALSYCYCANIKRRKVYIANYLFYQATDQVNMYTSKQDQRAFGMNES